MIETRHLENLLAKKSNVVAGKKVEAISKIIEQRILLKIKDFVLKSRKKIPNGRVSLWCSVSSLQQNIS